jgi:hypothetical protein
VEKKEDRKLSKFSVLSFAKLSNSDCIFLPKFTTTLSKLSFKSSTLTYTKRFANLVSELVTTFECLEGFKIEDLKLVGNSLLLQIMA